MGGPRRGTTPTQRTSTRRTAKASTPTIPGLHRPATGSARRPRSRSRAQWAWRGTRSPREARNAIASRHRRIGHTAEPPPGSARPPPIRHSPATRRRRYRNAIENVRLRRAAATQMRLSARDRQRYRIGPPTRPKLLPPLVARRSHRRSAEKSAALAAKQQPDAGGLRLPVWASGSYSCSPAAAASTRSLTEMLQAADARDGSDERPYRSGEDRLLIARAVKGARL
jgi:hypothetical protein